MNVIPSCKSIDDLTNREILMEEGMAPKLTLREKLKLVFTNITVEPMMVCYTLPNVMTSLTMQNLNLEKACRVNLGISEDICDALASRNTNGYTERDEVRVQKLVASAMAYKNIVQSLIPSMMLMFLGSWSDRHNRRKPCILLPIIGEMVTITGFIICTYYFYELGLAYNVIAEAVPPAVTGGWFSMFMGVFSYIGTVSSLDTRTYRIGAVNMISNVSLTIGIALSGILYIKIGFYGVYILALCMYTTGLLYGIFRVKECPPPVPVPAPEDNVNDGEILEKKKKKGFLRDFFDWGHIEDTLHVAFKDGARNRKKRICTIMILVMVIIGPIHGEMNVMYLFVRYKYKWNEMDYSVFSTFTFISHMCGTIFSLLFFSKYLQLDDALLGMISSTSKILSCFIYAFASTPTIFYLAALVEMLNGTSFIAMRSIISKLVPPDELGKIYSLFGVSEALMPLVYGPMYSLVYKSTINYLPGAFFLVGGFLTMPAIFIFLWLYKQHKLDEIDEKLEPAQVDSLLKKRRSTLDEHELEVIYYKDINEVKGE